jgi:ubiquinone/menaquinone biosynthesis C-methylase UbiE
MNFWDKLMDTDEGAASYMLSYDEGPGSPLRHFIGSLINDGETVLDVGCGPGWNYDHFRQYGPKVYYRGLDYSARFIKVAQRRWRELNDGQPIPALSPFDVGDVRDIKEYDNSWDVVILQDVLEHTNGYERPLKEARRVARRRIIVTFWHLMDKEEDNPINDDGDDGWGAWYSKPKWEKYLDSLKLHWLHDEIPRKGEKHDIYVIDKEGYGTRDT